MESVTCLKNIAVTPKKLRLLLPRVKSLKPSQAVEVLAYMPQSSAKALYRSIRSAMSNAKSTLKTEESMLQFKTFLVEEGQKLKRYNPGGRGTARPYKKRYSHIKIVLVQAEETQRTVPDIETKPAKKERKPQEQPKKLRSKKAAAKKVPNKSKTI